MWIDTTKRISFKLVVVQVTNIESPVKPGGSDVEKINRESPSIIGRLVSSDMCVHTLGACWHGQLDGDPCIAMAVLGMDILQIN